MKKIKVYFRFFLLPILLLILGIVGWFQISAVLGNFQSTLIGTLLGVGISLATAESLKKLAEYKRVKKTFSLLKLTVIPYIRGQGEVVKGTIKKYYDIRSIEEAFSFFVHCASFNKLSESFDKSWLQLVYTQDFLDAISDDEHFNKIANAIFEILVFHQQLSTQSINAQINLQNNFSKLSPDQQKEIIENAKNVRDGLNDNVGKLLKYTEKLEGEIMKFLNTTGVTYSEFER